MLDKPEDANYIIDYHYIIYGSAFRLNRAEVRFAAPSRFRNDDVTRPEYSAGFRWIAFASTRYQADIAAPFAILWRVNLIAAACRK